jgi:hypothetical protein
MPSINQLWKTESRVNAILLPIATCVAVTDPHVIGLFVDRFEKNWTTGNNRGG